MYAPVTTNYIQKQEVAVTKISVKLKASTLINVVLVDLTTKVIQITPGLKAEQRETESLQVCFSLVLLFDLIAPFSR